MWPILSFKHPQNSSFPKSYSINVTSNLVIETFLELFVSLTAKVTIQLKLGCTESTPIYFDYEGNLHILYCFPWSPYFFATAYHVLGDKMEV